MAELQERLPHWDMGVVFPDVESKEFDSAFTGLIHRIQELEALFDRHAVGKGEAKSLDAGVAAAFEEVIFATNRTLDEARTVGTYLRCLVYTDSRHEAAQAKLSELQERLVRLRLLETRLSAWIGSLDVEALVERSPVARAHTFFLRKAKVEADHQMSPAEEELAAELGPSGTIAWSKLHTNLTSQLAVPIVLEGKHQELPLTAVRNLAHDPSRDVRRTAYEAELATWQKAALPLAAALNSVKGTVNVLAKRRRWQGALGAALFSNSIDRATLDAMMAAAHESFPDFRRYLRAKAQALCTKALAWYDLFAPVGEAGRTWTYVEGARFIEEQFGTYSPRLGGLAQRAFRERWIDAEPRDGKRSGAMCLDLRLDESRVLSNFTPCFSAVGTLAHELGHAYHNLALAERTLLQQETPMTLAETASIFCETLVTQAALRAVEPAEQIGILENSLQDACQVVVDITSRFLFEGGVFERRAERELSADELCLLMRKAQLETYGDGLDPVLLHPYAWAAKPHYYPMSFYNFPYMFGLLFGLGLFARYAEDPRRFTTSYDDLLSSTGMGDAAELAGRFGIDTRSVTFWRSSLDVVREDIVRFESLVGVARAS